MKDDDINNTDLERILRESLHRHAEQISPRERRTEIVAMAHDETQAAEPKRRWLIPVAAAASVALIGAVAWGLNNGSPQNSQVASSTSSPSKTASSPATAAHVPNPQSAGASNAPATVPGTSQTTDATLPAYFVGANSGTGDRFGLYREFVRATVPVEATPAQKAKAAVALAMNAQPFANLEPYLQPWAGTSVQDVMVTPSLITIKLSGPGASGFTAEQTRLAVQQLVWTAQAAIVQGAVPVKFAVADRSAMLFGTYPTAGTYNRQYQDLAPIWITSPDRDQALPAGASVVAQGQSCAFEATTQWQLKKGGTAVKSGFTTASSGCPTRGTWKVKLGALAAGSYTFRMYEVSMQDGQGIVAETSRSFTVK